MKIRHYRLGAILVTLICLQVCGLVALYYSGRVEALLAAGDQEGARAASKMARRWIGLGVLSFITLLIVGFTWLSRRVVLQG